MTAFPDLEKRLRAVEPLDFVPHAVPVELCTEAADAIAALSKQVEELDDELVDARLEPWPEWADKLLRILQDFGAEYDADDEINLPDELAEWLHHYASDLKQSRARLSPASDAENSDGR